MTPIRLRPDFDEHGNIVLRDQDGRVVDGILSAMRVARDASGAVAVTVEIELAHDQNRDGPLEFKGPGTDAITRRFSETQ